MISLDQIKASLIDDIGLYHQQLLNFRFDAINCTLRMENGMEDASSYILRKFGIYEYPYLEGKFAINASSKYYNFESGAEEPFIENWELSGTLRKAQANSFSKEGIISLSNPLLLLYRILYKFQHQSDLWNCFGSQEDNGTGAFDDKKGRDDF
jgi:hypothetical protein